MLRPIRRLASPRTLLLAALLVACGAREAAAVSVSPLALYIDSRSRTGTLTLFNPGSLPEDVEIGFAFGYPQADSAGNVVVRLSETAPAGEPSAVEWLRAFPRRLTIQPGQRQVVRVMVSPPPGLEEGEYWSRVIIRSRGGQPPIEQTQGEYTFQVAVVTELVVAVNYRNGDVSTGLDVVEAEARREGGEVVAEVELRRTGNAAFLGRLHAEVVDASGRVVGTAEDVLAVYRSIRRRLVVPVPADAAGPLRVRLRMDTERDDLPPDGPLPVEPVTAEVPVG